MAAVGARGTRALGALTAGAVRRPWLTVAVWVLGAVVLLLSAPSLNDVGEQDQSAFLPDGAPSHYAAQVMAMNMMARDAEEGIGAFIAKRDPKWEDR